MSNNLFHTCACHLCASKLLRIADLERERDNALRASDRIAGQVRAYLQAQIDEVASKGRELIAENERVRERAERAERVVKNLRDALGIAHRVDGGDDKTAAELAQTLLSERDAAERSLTAAREALVAVASAGVCGVTESGCSWCLTSRPLGDLTPAILAGEHYGECPVAAALKRA